MAKVKIDCTIKNITLNEEVKLVSDGILNNKKIVYKDKDAICELVIEEKEVTFLKKRFDGINLRLNFKDKKNNYIDVLGDGYSTRIPLLTESISIENNKIEVIYQIDNNERFLFCLIYE